MSKITHHHDGFKLAESIEVESTDSVGPGGAHHQYRATIDGTTVADIKFQRGPRNEPGSTPGILDSVLVAIAMDRLEAFQRGPFECNENDQAYHCLEQALYWMKKRASNRAKRGVLGTTKP